MQVFAGIIAIAKALPVINAWLEKFVTFYVSQELKSMKKENVDVIREAYIEHDQRGIEKAIGNPSPGEPSGDPGTHIVDHLPPGIGMP